MQYEVNTPAEYFEILEDDWRKETLLSIRDTIISRAPDLNECIEYKMLAYKENDKSVFHLNAQKHFVGFYVGDIHKIDKNGDLLEGLDMGKGCIRFKKSNKIAETRIGEFIEKTMEMVKKGEDFDC
ncbi:iron chaperone [Flexithrix dorotheae]|uniref:iron chaperone n=1 Tax=Flexithrix dorotheae TaxID=70993 RepID=UPI000375AF94|nr:DUF1801 domain-containing protein [Flexithrix dorotheae]